MSMEGTACSARLINDGVNVNGGRAIIEFSSSGLSVSDFQCSLGNVHFESGQVYSCHTS